MAYDDSVHDEQLVTQVVAGNTDAFAELISRYEAPLLRYLVYLVHDRDMAEDILQDSFIKAYRNLAGFNVRRKFSSWIYRIAHNTAMDAVKKRRPIAIPNDPDLTSVAIVEPGIAEKIDKEILAKDVSQCLAQLPAKYQEPLFLYYFQHQSYAEISDVLRVPVATIGVRIRRAKIRLKEACKYVEVAV